MTRTQKVLKSGLCQWVDDYKKVRRYGNLILAIQIRDNILREIIRLRLNANEVWGIDPDKPEGGN